MSLLYQLSRPLAYLSVRGPTLSVYKVWAPLSLSAVGLGIAAILPKGIVTTGDNSLTSFLVQLFAMLPGFYIAALAAIVAFQGGDLDKEIPDLTAKISANRDTSRVEITLRVFLCYLFSYLTTLSLLGFGVCAVGSLVAPSVKQMLLGHHRLQASAEYLYIAVTAWITFSIVAATMQALYFLAERVHQTLLEDAD